MNITNGNKLIAEYLGWVYIPFNDPQGRPKGWHEVASAEPNIQEATITSYSSSNPEKTVAKKEINFTPLRYNLKNGWILNGDKYYRYVCRAHHDLRFYNNFDALMPAIEKLDKNGFHCILSCGGIEILHSSSWNSVDHSSGLTWIQNCWAGVVEAIRYHNVIKE